MSDDKVKVITEDLIYKSIITFLGLAFVITMSIALQSQTNKSNLVFFAIEVILAVVMISVFVNFITIFCDIKNRIKLKKSSEL